MDNTHAPRLVRRHAVVLKGYVIHGSGQNAPDLGRKMYELAETGLNLVTIDPHFFQQCLPTLPPPPEGRGFTDRNAVCPDCCCWGRCWVARSFHKKTSTPRRPQGLSAQTTAVRVLWTRSVLLCTSVFEGSTAVSLTRGVCHTVSHCDVNCRRAFPLCRAHACMCTKSIRDRCLHALLLCYILLLLCC